MGIARVYLSPGLFGFSKLGTYDYFVHVELELARRFEAAGRELAIHVVQAHPTASLYRRARRLAEVIEATAGEGDTLHLLGHSTGGLDARLVASPGTCIAPGARAPVWRDAIRSVTMMNTPHYGTPLASFFATVSGQRVLYALSAISFTALKFGAPPMAITSSLVAAFGRIDRALGLELKIVDQLTDRLVRMLDDASSDDLRAYFQKLRDDQGAIIQLSPEAMQLFAASVADHPGIQYQSTASYVMPPGVVDWARSVAAPWLSPSATLFAMLQRITAIEHRMYPTAPEDGAAENALGRLLGHLPPAGASDGIVPVRSQVWGNLVWAGRGDHLDVVGHFGGKGRNGPHYDWFTSGAAFDGWRFDRLLDAVTAGMLKAEAR